MGCFRAAHCLLQGGIGLPRQVCHAPDVWPHAGLAAAPAHPVRGTTGRAVPAAAPAPRTTCYGAGGGGGLSAPAVLLTQPRGACAPKSQPMRAMMWGWQGALALGRQKCALAKVLGPHAHQHAACRPRTAMQQAPAHIKPRNIESSSGPLPHVHGCTKPMGGMSSVVRRSRHGILTLYHHTEYVTVAARYLDPSNIK